MRRGSWLTRLVPILMVSGVASLLLSLWFGGFIAYQWVLACEATAASLVLFLFYVRHHGNDPRKSKWPPLLSLSVIFAAGGAKSFFVAMSRDTPLVVIVFLLAGVVWFIFDSWKIWKAERVTTP